MASSQAVATCPKTRKSACQELLFIDDTPKGDVPQNVKRMAQKKSVRAQAARASSNARLETMRKRAEGRTRLPGQRVFPIRVSTQPQHRGDRPPRAVVEQCESRYRDREASVTLHAHILLGGSIPVAQANVAILGQFLHRFKSETSAERPWVELVMAEAASSATPSLVSMALHANASALCANDLQQPEVQRHATKLYLSTVTQLRSSLSSPSWHDSVVMYTCMILTLYECIQSNDPSASHAHVRGVARLVQQKGPQSFVRGLEHKTFRYYRINILMMCLHDRQRSFLAEAEWKTIPFSGDCPPKTVLDQLVDVLVEVPGVLAAVETLRKGEIGRYALIRKAFELTYWVRCLIYDLERWRETCIHTYPTICTTPHLKNLDVLALCELGTGLPAYDARLGEALNCYAAAHLILARIAQRLAEGSFIIRTILHPPYCLRNLVAAIVLVSEKHINAKNAGMISIVVTTFPLKVAQSTSELHEPVLSKTVQELLDQINHHLARRYNINYSMPSETRAYEV